jgi:hypothetical protein
MMLLVIHAIHPCTSHYRGISNTPAIYVTGAAMILTGDETILAGAAMFIAAPASFSAAGAMKSAGEFTDGDV